MQNYNFKTNSEDETMKLGEKLAKLCAPKDIIILSGELGAGKTKFTEGFLKYFGLDDEISSPTFTIVNEYTKNDINIYHFDVYRLEDSSEFYEIGGEEYFENGICLIEWGEIIQFIQCYCFISIVTLKIYILHFNTYILLYFLFQTPH